MKLGSIEQWTLVNETQRMAHVPHPHQRLPGRERERQARPVRATKRTTSRCRPSSKTVVLMQPSDFTGKFVFHCHVTFHEDHGMMATIEVVREPTAAASSSSVVRRPGLAISSSRYGRESRPLARAPPSFWCAPKRSRRSRA